MAQNVSSCQAWRPPESVRATLWAAGDEAGDGLGCVPLARLWQRPSILVPSTHSWRRIALGNLPNSLKGWSQRHDERNWLGRRTATASRLRYNDGPVVSVPWIPLEPPG